MKKITPKNMDVKILVDDEDYDYLNQFNWFISKQGYATRNIKLAVNKWTKITMHRPLMNATVVGMDVDHIDGNRINNQKSNLRMATRSQNMMNLNKKKTNSLSKYKGVSRYNRPNLKNQWVAYIKKDDINMHLGYFETEEEAAHMYNQFAEQLFGEFASLNDIYIEGGSALPQE